MSDQENEVAECPFSGHGEELVNVKFFRGRRDDVISAEELKEQARSARMQVTLGTADRSSFAPRSAHSQRDVTELVASL